MKVKTELNGRLILRNKDRNHRRDRKDSYYVDWHEELFSHLLTLTKKAD